MAIFGEKNGVDQFRFATRKLREEGDVKTIFVQFFKQASETLPRLRIGKLVFRQPALVAIDSLDKLRAPMRIGGKLLSECHESERPKVRKKAEKCTRNNMKHSLSIM